METIKTNAEGLRAARAAALPSLKFKFDRLDLALVVWFVLCGIATKHVPDAWFGVTSGVFILLAFLDRSLRLILRELRQKRAG
jgi:hypothetical protein